MKLDYTLGTRQFDSYGVGLAGVILAFAFVLWYFGGALWFVLLWACLGLAVLAAAGTLAGEVVRV
ncbi:hypothetical protein [Natronorarus salvus]|uniref:hypothetical protein n=1 Tax=Natronorarus salvus TaxID=3117733 RepID=UPI002F26B03F